VKVNGAVTALESETVAELLARNGIGAWTKFVAVAVNGAVVPRADWATTRLAAEDEVEIIRPQQGG
jgi:sulfur carrier protein